MSRICQEAQKQVAHEQQLLTAAPPKDEATSRPNISWCCQAAQKHMAGLGVLC